MISFTRNSNSILENQTYNDTETINIFQTNGAVFKNCIFKKNIIFKNIDLNDGLYFENCVFEDNLYISNCKSLQAQNIEIQGESGATITLKKCVVKNKFQISGILNQQRTAYNATVLKRGLLIEENTEIGELIFNYSESENVGITINQSIIKRKFALAHSSIKGTGLHISESNIQDFFRCENIKGTSFSFIRTIFDKSFQIWGNRLSQGVTFNYGTYNEDVEIYATKCGTLTIYDGDFRKHLRIRCIDNNTINNEDGLSEEQRMAEVVQGAPKDIYINNSKFGDRLLITSNDINRFDLEKIVIRSTKEQKGDIIFEKLNINNELLLEGTNYDSNIHFQDIVCKKIKINNFTNFATVIFQRFRNKQDGESSLEIKGSDLGNTTFLNCEFHNFEIVIIEDSILSQIKYSNVKWFKFKKINKNSNKKDSIYWSSIREVFRQLKYSAENSMDKPDALRFKSYEMRAYNDYLLKDGWFKNLGDIIILKLNFLSNTHGLNWAKGILFTIMTWITFFGLYVMIRDGYSFQFYENSVFLLSQKEFWKEAIDFLWLPEGVNSITGDNGLFNKNITGGMPVLGVIFFLLGKIAIAYGIFQVISAFRKYVK